MLSGMLRGWFGKREATVEDGIERDCTLRVFLNDRSCELTVCDKQDAVAGRVERNFSGSQTSPEAMLAAAVEVLAPELAARVGNVEIFVDDQEISVVDSRQAKLSHFEGRALAEFGKYQLGGKPVCFASYRFGETSAQEAEKRIVAYISEDRLTAVLFALGKLARFTTFFGPWSLQSLLAEESEETQAKLSVHGKYSSLAIASSAAGAIAVRNFPVGSASLINAYSKEYGISAEEAENALRSRARLGDGKLDAPTGSQLALMPILNGLSGEVGATADYFEFQRLAGRAGSLQLSVLGARVAGFANWLTGMLNIDVSEAAPARPPKPVLNLLEGMRGGLLKLGNQHFDFVGGRFVRSTTVVSPGASDDQDLMSRLRKASKQSLTVNDLKPFARPAAVLAAVLVAIVGGYNYVLAPSGAELDTTVRLYENVLTQGTRPQGQGAQVPASEPVLWAKDLVSIAGSLPYDVRLKQVMLVPATGTAGATLQITGLLPQGGQDNLQLVGRFISKLSESVKLRHRLGEINFAGVGQGSTSENPQSQFSIVAKITEGPKP